MGKALKMAQQKERQATLPAGRTAIKACSPACPALVGGRWRAEWPLVLSLSLELQDKAVLAGRGGGGHRSALQSPTLFPSSSGCYCTASGTVLTTWVVSAAVGGGPKKVLVWFL